MPGHENDEPRENPGFDGLRWVQTGSLMTPTGFEQQQKTRAKMGLGGSGPLPVPSSLPITDPGAEELMAIWAALDQGGREDLLAVARGLAAVKS